MKVPPDFLSFQDEIEREIHQVWSPHDGQLPIICDFLINWVVGVFVQCGRKFGKMMDLEEVIPTPQGMRRYGDLLPGDELFDEKGRVQHVLQVHPIDLTPVSYRVHFDNGTHIDACADHRWMTWTKADRKNERRGLRCAPAVRTTQDIHDSLMSGSEYNHSIPAALPLQMPERDLPIDPYLLGAWLGDGHTHKAAITGVDAEILDAFWDGGFEMVPYDHQTYGITGGFLRLLKDNGLLHNKHIPADYLIASEHQRRELLKGLMDTDGTVNKVGNSCEYVSKLRILAEGVFQLTASLGMRPRMMERVIDGRTYWRVFFRPYGEVFRLKRKQTLVRAETCKRNHHTIVAVEPIDPKPMRCITVSGKSQLYLAGRSMIPTHNTELAIYLCYMYALLFPGSEIYYVVNEKDHARDICWDNGRLPYFLSRLVRGETESQEDFELRQSKGRQLEKRWIAGVNNSEMNVKFKNGSVIKVEGAKNFTIADGLSPTFIVYDEFKDHDKRFDERMRPNMMAKKGRILIIGTPPGDEENYYCSTAKEFVEKPLHKFYLRPCYENPVVYPGGKNDPALLAEKEAYRKKGELHVYYREYLAQITPDQTRSIFPMFDEDKHVRPHEELIHWVKSKSRNWELYSSFDPGTTSVFANLQAAIHKYDKRVVLLNEIYETDAHQTVARLIYPRSRELRDEVDEFYDHWQEIYDYEAAYFAQEIAHEFNVGVMPCTKDLKNKENKLSVIKDAMLYGRFFVSERCKKTIWEIKNYAKDDKGKIPKKNDHNIDNLRYILNQNGYSSVPREMLNLDEASGRRYHTIESDIQQDRQQLALLGGVDDLDYDDDVGDY